VAMWGFNFYFLKFFYGSDIFGSKWQCGDVIYLFIYLFIFELNSCAFQLEIKW